MVRITQRFLHLKLNPNFPIEVCEPDRDGMNVPGMEWNVMECTWDGILQPGQGILRVPVMAPLVPLLHPGDRDLLLGGQVQPGYILALK